MGDILKAMNANDEWPNATNVSYSCALKALNLNGQREPFTHEEGWRLVGEIMDMMRDNGVSPHTAVYSSLFNLCGGRFCNQPDLERLKGFYADLQTQGLKLNPSAAQNLLLSGVDCFVWMAQQNPEDKEAIKAECMAYVDWALLQYKEHGV